MLLFPNAKINLGLSIVNKRTDGYHDLETVFVPVAWFDALEFVPANELNLHTGGIQVTENPESNLVWKAYQLMLIRFPHLPSIEIHLQKNIPHGAGLGGGSADAAFLLKALNDYFSLSLSSTELMDMALLLGSDCPFFILNKPCFATGRGEVLSPISLNLKNYQVILVKPPFPIPTALAFQHVQPKKPLYRLTDIIQEPISTWKKTIVNDFEPALLTHFPEIQTIKDTLYDLGCNYASLSGSGSTVYGIFEMNKREAIESEISVLNKKIRDIRIHIADFIS